MQKIFSIVQILAPLAANLNACDKKGLTPNSVQNSCVDIIRILAPLTDNPNMQQDITGTTPIHIAAAVGAVEIVKMLAPLANNLNATNK